VILSSNGAQRNHQSQGEQSNVPEHVLWMSVCVWCVGESRTVEANDVQPEIVSACVKLGLNRVRAVRVHVNLPGWGDDNVLGNDPLDENLTVHLDNTNVHHLLGSDEHGLYNLLAVATDTAKETWVGRGGSFKFGGGGE
jgi:hypothetical protein